MKNPATSKFQVDTPVNTKVTAVQNFENLYTYVYNIIENSPNSFARNSDFIGPNVFKFGTETRFMVISNFGANQP